jgi:hypothetical protein
MNDQLKTFEPMQRVVLADGMGALLAGQEGIVIRDEGRGRMSVLWDGTHHADIIHQSYLIAA